MEKLVYVADTGNNPIQVFAWRTDVEGGGGGGGISPNIATKRYREDVENIKNVRK